MFLIQTLVLALLALSFVAAVVIHNRKDKDFQGYLLMVVVVGVFYYITH